jgi:hypothetical protein
MKRIVFALLLIPSAVQAQTTLMSPAEQSERIDRTVTARVRNITNADALKTKQLNDTKAELDKTKKELEDVKKSK